MALTNLLPTKPATGDSFLSSGVTRKPAGCLACQFHQSGAGFVADHGPVNPRLALLLDYPSADDVMEQRPWSGRGGYAWIKQFLEPVGLRRDEVLISSILRCRPTGFPTKYPTGSLKRNCEITCRQYDSKQWSAGGLIDGGIVGYNPNMFIITLAPIDSRMVPALGRLIVKDMEKAVRKASEGFRPLILMGTEAMDLVCPFLSGKGGAPAWRGHYMEAEEWPWSTKDSVLVKPGFLAPSTKWTKR